MHEAEQRLALAGGETLTMVDERGTHTIGLAQVSDDGSSFFDRSADGHRHTLADVFLDGLAVVFEQERHESERATLYRLFRPGAITEGDLDAQIAEIAGEADALTDERERLQAEWERVRNSQGALESAEQLLDRLRLKLDATDEAAISWETKRRIVEELVAGIEVESRFDAGARQTAHGGCWHHLPLRSTRCQPKRQGWAQRWRKLALRRCRWPRPTTSTRRFRLPQGDFAQATRVLRNHNAEVGPLTP